MWIRSQDGKSLTDCNSFAVERFFKQYEVVTFNRSGISVALGIYSSEEKALRVLDEIQEWYECSYGETFQMPQDEEDF